MSIADAVIPIERIASRIYLIRGEKVMLDSDLAELYGVSTAQLNQQVKRNIERFPPDFAFKLKEQEFAALMSQIVISKERRGGRRKLPWVFNEQGVAMLSSVLKSKRAVQINLAIIRAFVRLRRILATHRDLARKIEEHDRQIGVLFDMVQQILSPPAPKKRPIGFITPKD
jgi:phage regulator Rha-like protein